MLIHAVVCQYAHSLSWMIICFSNILHSVYQKQDANLKNYYLCPRLGCVIIWKVISEWIVSFFIYIFISYFISKLNKVDVKAFSMANQRPISHSPYNATCQIVLKHKIYHLYVLNCIIITYPKIQTIYKIIWSIS